MTGASQAGAPSLFDRTIQVPGKIMLCGEYAVLSGGLALSASVDRPMQIQACSSRKAGMLCIRSDLWEGERRFPFAACAGLERSSILESVLIECAPWLDRFTELEPGLGLEIDIRSELDLGFGIGSSSALSLGLCSLLHAAAFQDLDSTRPPWAAVERAYFAQRNYQGRASGYDLACQYAGGLVEFRSDTRTGSIETDWLPHIQRSPQTRLERLADSLIFLGSGGGDNTRSSVNQSLAYFKQRENQLMECSQSLHQAFLALADTETPNGRAQAVDRLLSALKGHQSLFRGSPSFPLQLVERLESLPGCGRDWGFKPTGAGGEDLFLLIAKDPAQIPEILAAAATFGVKRVDVKLSGQKATTNA